VSTTSDSRVLAILARVVRRDVSTLKPDLDLASDLDVGSAQALELLATLEEELQLEISEVDAAKLRTVGDVLAYVARVKG
jgi:acyl carrier protein